MYKQTKNRVEYRGLPQHPKMVILGNTRGWKPKFALRTFLSGGTKKLFLFKENWFPFDEIHLMASLTL